MRDNSSLLLFHCVCPPGFSGEDCSKVATTTKSISVAVNATTTKGSPVALGASHSKSNNDIPPWAWIIFATGVIVVIAIIAAAIILRGRKPSSNPHFTASGANSYSMDGSGGDVLAFENPIADHETDSAALATSAVEENA